MTTKTGIGLKQQREDRGWTQAEFAARLEVPQSRVSEWENGVHFPSHDTVLKLAEAFGVEFVEVYRWLGRVA